VRPALGSALALALGAIGCQAGGASASGAPSASSSASAPGASDGRAAAGADAGTVVASAATDAGAEAGATAADASWVPPRTWAFEDIPTDKSPLPKPAEWRDIPSRKLWATSEYTCHLETLREWARITCGCANSTAALVTGTRDGVSVFASTERAQLLFPLRRGDRRVFEIHPHPTHQQAGYGFVPVDSGPPLVISELWLEGDAMPSLTMQ
jgi:hypothetical protein